MHIILGILVTGLILWAFNISVKRFVQVTTLGAVVLFACAAIYLQMNPPSTEVAELDPWEEPVRTPSSSPLIHRIYYCMDFSEQNGKIDNDVYQRCMGR